MTNKSAMKLLEYTKDTQDEQHTELKALPKEDPTLSRNLNSKT